MKLNLKFYKGKDEYSDGDIEDRIIEFIKKYPDNYEQAFDEDSSWPVFYHLSDVRKNSIRWYPFKKDSSILEVGGGMGAITSELCKKCQKVTTIELSKRRATAILERNKDVDNLEIIVGNFKDIKLKEKYDYILLNGVLEYGALYMDSDNPYQDFINKLKENLKTDGKILIAIENRFGLKYWCGANEDHTGRAYDGINGYLSSCNVKTFSKNELELLAKRCGMNANFYYMFPDYKFPEIIYTDKSLNKNIFVNYIPYYYKKMDLLVDERNLYKSIIDNKMIPFFANSYFVEFSNVKQAVEVEFVKFNSFRKKEYNLYTFCIDGKYYKKNIYDEALPFYNNYINSTNELKEASFDTIEIINDEIGSYTNEIKNNTFLDTILEKYNSNDMDAFYNKISEYKNYIFDKYDGKFINPKVSIFDKYNIGVSEEFNTSMHYIKKGFIDIVPQNMIVIDNKFYLFDQEWYMDNVPCEFIVYRGISSVFHKLGKPFQEFEKCLEKFGLDKYKHEFSLLEEEFQKDIVNVDFNIIQEYSRYNFVPGIIDSKDREIQCLSSNLELLRQDNEKLKENLNSIYNSRRWKLMNKILKIFGR